MRGDVVGTVRFEVRAEWEQRVIWFGEGADCDAERGGKRHRQEHVPRGFLAPFSGIVREERKVRDLDAGVLEHARGSKQQHQP